MNQNNEMWWQIYRKNQYRLKKLNFEMILRKSFKDVVTEYVMNSSIAGVKEICAPRIGIRYRFIWIILFSMMVGTTCYFLYLLWIATLTKPLVVSMDSSTYPITEIDFPAVALCNVNRISHKSLTEFAEEMYPLLAKNNESFSYIRQYFLQLGRLLDFSWAENLRKHPLSELLAKQYGESKIVIQLMKELAPSCKEMLKMCTWDGQFVDCMELFDVRRTVRGHCCAFNYILGYNSAGKPNSTISKVKRQIISGPLKGLNVVIDPLVDDYAYPINNIIGFDIFLHDPTHFADINAGRVIHRIVEGNTTIHLQLHSVKQMATQEVRKYPLSARQCLFHDEKKEKFGDMYSYSACIVSCRIRTVQSLCKCTPYFFPTSENNQHICTLDKLPCLNQYKEKLLYLYPYGAMNNEGLEMEIQDSLYCPECLPDCEFTKHYTKAFKLSMEISVLKENSSKQDSLLYRNGINMSNVCTISIYQSTEDGVLDRLDIISYWFEVVSNIGGFAGILLGFSFVSVVEILYFFVLRFITLIIKNYNEYH
ncbi:hypothetical protein ACJJTC_016322 [Scirpophaga incertulas]